MTGLYCKTVTENKHLLCTSTPYDGITCKRLQSLGAGQQPEQDFALNVTKQPIKVGGSN